MLGRRKDKPWLAKRVSWEGFSSSFATSDDELKSEVEQDCAEWAALFDTRVDGYFIGLAKRGEYVRGSSSIDITNHRY